MSDHLIYLDNAASTKICPEATEKMLQALNEDFGNPSSTHLPGRRARLLMEDARKNIAAVLGAAPERVFFTSGGTEADNWALFGAAERMKHRGGHILTTAIEHDAVLKSTEELHRRGFEVEYLKPDAAGNIPLSAFEQALRDDTVLISAMLVNNEVGSVLPVADIAAMLRRRGSKALLHTDAVQAFMKIPFTARGLGADLISVSSHKIRGPKGAGALYIRAGLSLPPLLFGGGQEDGLRSGTENVPAIVGFGAAAKRASEHFTMNTSNFAMVKQLLLRRMVEVIPDALVIGSHEAPHIVCISLPGYGAEVLMNYLDARGICVSRGSACKKGRRSHVLAAMGLPDAVIDGALRVSLGEDSTEEDIEAFVTVLSEARQNVFGALRKQ